MDNFLITERNKIKRSPHRGAYDRETVYEILDAAFVCHVGFVDRNSPVVIPMTYGRKDDKLYLHGASPSRIMNVLADDNPVCVSVALVDGIVFARSMFDTSVNYRSVVLFGKPELVDDDEKIAALHCISEHILPGRWQEVRQPLPNELKATAILKLSIETASAKIRTGPPKDDARDMNLPVWAGVVPLTLKAGEAVSDPALQVSQVIPASVHSLLERYS